MKDKKRFSVWRLLPAILTVIVLTLYFPVYNQPGVHTEHGFLQNTGDGLYQSGTDIVKAENGVLTFSGDYHALTVTVDSEVYTIAQDGGILFSGKAPDPAHDRLIQADGLLVSADAADENADYYPVSVANAIAIATGSLETRGSSRYLTLALAVLLIWCVDILFPNFFFKADFRNVG